MTDRRRILLVSLLLCLLMAHGSASGRSIWLDPRPGDEIRLEAVKPAFDNLETSTFSLVWFLSGDFEINKGLRFSADLPYAHFARDGMPESSNTVGNPYLGVNIGTGDSAYTSDFGVRLPLASREEAAAEFGYAATFVDRMETFYPEVLSVIVGGNYSHRSPDGVELRLRVSPILWIDTGDRMSDDVEAFVRYSAQIIFDTGSAALGSGLSGRYFATAEGDGDFGEKSLHEFDLFVNLNAGKWRPSLRVRFPLDENLTDVVDTSFVLGMGMILP